MAKLVSQADYARHRKVTRKTVTMWKQSGLLAMVDGKVDLRESDKRIAAHGLRDRAAAKDSDNDEPIDDAALESLAELFGGDDAGLSKREAERVKENFLAKKHRLDYLQKSGKLVDRTEIEKKIFEKARIERDAWLNWPVRIAAVLAAELRIDKNVMMVTLEKHVRAHLEQRAMADAKP